MTTDSLTQFACLAGLERICADLYVAGCWVLGCLVVGMLGYWDVGVLDVGNGVASPESAIIPNRRQQSSRFSDTNFMSRRLSLIAVNNSVASATPISGVGD